MRRIPIAQIEHRVIDVAITPSLGRVISFDNGMSGRVKMFCRVAVRRTVTASNMTASSTQAQMYPRRPDRKTFLAPESTWDHVANGIGVKAFFGHCFSDFPQISWRRSAQCGVLRAEEVYCSALSQLIIVAQVHQCLI